MSDEDHDVDGDPDEQPDDTGPHGADGDVAEGEASDGPDVEHGDAAREDSQEEPPSDDDLTSGEDLEESRAETIAPDSAGDQPAVGPRPIEDEEQPDAEGEASAGDEGGGAGESEPPVEDALLQVRDLDAGYGDLQILSGVTLDVDDGEYVTIVGPNGAGKSTAMKSIFGLTNVMGGTIRFDDGDVTDLRPEDIIHTGIGYVPQSDNVFTGLSVLENLEMGAYILDEVPQAQLQAVYDRFPILEERKHQTAGTLSGGQQQMLAMGRALMLDPDLLLLDEPSAGLAPDLVEDMFDRIDGINDSGTAVLMVEQNAKEALRRCDRGYVLVQGENRYEDEGEVLLGDEEVRQQFLGG
jgi:ABC-type branched-subunit amino acid transport system ATPase component